MVKIHKFLTSTLHENDRLASSHGRFKPGEYPTVPILWEAKWILIPSKFSERKSLCCCQESNPVSTADLLLVWQLCYQQEVHNKMRYKIEQLRSKHCVLKFYSFFVSLGYLHTEDSEQITQLILRKQFLELSFLKRKIVRRYWMRGRLLLAASSGLAQYMTRNHRHSRLWFSLSSSTAFSNKSRWAF